MSQSGSTHNVEQETTESNAVASARQDRRLTEGSTQPLPDNREVVWFEGSTKAVERYHSDPKIETFRINADDPGMDANKVGIVLGKPVQSPTAPTGPEAPAKEAHPEELERRAERKAQQKVEEGLAKRL